MKLGANFEGQKPAPPKKELKPQKEAAEVSEFDTGSEKETPKGTKGGPKKKVDKTVVIIIVLFILVFLVAVIFINKSGKLKQQEQSMQEDANNTTEVVNSEDAGTSQELYDENGNLIYDKDGNLVVDNPVTVGDINYNTDNFSVDNRITEYTYVKDLNGAQVPADYTVTSIEYIDDHANYVAHRSIVDDGMELYWLDIDYKGKKYICQCSFNFFRALDRSGICKIRLEVLTLQGGGTIISDVYLISEDN